MAAYSVVVVTWECAAHLRALVESIDRHLPADVELIVVDNASSDAPADSARRRSGGARFIPLERNRGFGAAANVGVEAASHEGIVLLNPDTLLVDASLGELVGFALERGALAGPRLLNADGSLQPSASGPPVGAWPWIGAVAPGAIQPAAIKARTEPWRLERTTRVAWLTGACVAATRSVLRSLGPFDSAIRLYAEDMDLGIRAGRAGVQSWFCPEVCRIVHHGGASAAVLLPDGSEGAVAANRRAVLHRAFGPNRERAAWRAQRLNLALRVLAKRALGREARRERASLEATRAASAVDPLPQAARGASEP